MRLPTKPMFYVKTSDIIKYFLVAFHKTFFFYRLVIKTTVETFEKKFNSETDKNYNSTYIHVQ